MNIFQINEQIAALTRERDKIIGEQQKEKNQYIASLEWTKGYAANFKMQPIYGAGIPRYIVEVWGNPEKPYEGILVYDKGTYYRNVYYGSQYLIEYPCFYSYDGGSMLEFLDKATFRSLKFDEGDLAILTKVAEISKRFKEAGNEN